MFSYPHYINSVTFTTAAADRKGFSSSLLGPFELKIWLFLFSLVSIAFLFGFSLNRELRKSSQIQWSVVSIILGQTTAAFKSKLISLRFFIICWLLSALVLKNVYSGELFRLMTFTAEGDKIETIDEFIQALKTQRLKILTQGPDSIFLTKLKVNYINYNQFIKVSFAGPRAKRRTREEIS